MPIIHFIIFASVFLVGGVFLADVVQAVLLRDSLRKQERHWFAATATVLLCYIAYVAIKRGIFVWSGTTMVVPSIGTALVVVGAMVNVWARIVLGVQWASALVVYQMHQLITAGPYRYVRHPLYASLFVMFVGSALVYRNGSVLMIALLFLFFSYQRARDEERFLIQHLKGYAAYMLSTQLFFPLKHQAMPEKKVQISPRLLSACRLSTAGLLGFFWWTGWYWGVVGIIASFWWGATHEGQSLLYSWWQIVLPRSWTKERSNIPWPGLRFAQALGGVLLSVALFFVFVRGALSVVHIWMSIVIISSLVGASGTCVGMQLYTLLNRLAIYND